MIKKIIVTSMMATSLFLAACDGGPKQTLGTVGGAVGGGLLGSQVGKGRGQLVAVGVGTLLGALAGSEIGKSLDNADRLAANQATQQSLNGRVGETINWNNPNSGNRGNIITTRDGYSQSGRYCREYQQTVVVGGRSEKGYGQACRQPDGSWEIVR